MATVIDTLVTVIDFKTNTAGIKKAEGALKSLEIETKALNAAVINLGHVFTGLFSIFAVEKLIELNNQYDISINKLRSLSLQGDKVGEMFEKLLIISNKTGTSVEKNVELYQQMSIALRDTASEADKLTVVDTLNKIFAISGTNTRVATFAMQDLSKAVAGQAVNYAELRFAMKDVPALQAVIVKHFDELGQNWIEQIKGGRLATTEFIKILKDANVDLTKQFALTARTIPQAFQAIRNSLSFFIGEVGKSSESVSGFTGILDKLAEMFVNLGKAVKDNQKEIKSFFGAFLTFLSLVSIRVAFITARMLLPFLPLIAGISFLTLTIQDLYVFLQGGDSVIGGFLNSIGLTKDNIKSLRDGINLLISGLVSLIQWILSSKITIISLSGVLVGLGAAWGIQKIISFVKELKKLAVMEFIVEFFTAFVEVLKSFGVLEFIIGMFEGLAIAVNAVAASFGVLELISAPFLLIAGIIIAAIIGIIVVAYVFRDEIIDAFSTAFNWLKGAFDSTANFLNEKWDSMIDNLTEPFNKFIAGVMKGFGIVKSVANKLSFGFIGGDDSEEETAKISNFQGDNIGASKRKVANGNIANILSNANDVNAQLLNGTTGTSLPQSSFSNVSQNNENNINVTVNAETNASPEAIAEVATAHIKDAMGRQFKSAALNTDSTIKR